MPSPLRKLTPLRLGILASVVTLSLSQILFDIVAGNVDEFPEEARFHLGLLFWIWALPLAAVGAVDLLLVPDDAADGKAARGWRGALYTLTALSFARQFQARYLPGLIDPLDNALRLSLVAAVATLLWALLLRSRLRPDRYFGVLGLLAVLLVGRYAWAVGLWGPAWRVGGVPEERMLRGDPARPPVFVLLFDELGYDVLAGPDGRPDRTLYPRLAALADDGLWFVNATTNSGFTEPALHLMYTGALPEPDGRATLPMLFDRLPAGYVAEVTAAWPPVARWIRTRQAGNPRFVQRDQAAFFVPGFFELPGRLLEGLAQSPVFDGDGFAEGDFDLPGGWEHRRAEGRLASESDALIQAVRSPRARGRLFLWHTSLPHFPYVFDENGRLHGDPATNFIRFPFDDALRNYRRQVRSLDLIVGRFVDALKEAGLYEEAIVVLTSDHGLRTWRSSRTRQTVDDRMARVPFLIKAPGVAPGVTDVDYQHLDFAPTLLDLMGSPPPPMTGVSALSPARPKRDKWAESGGDVWRRDPRAGAWSR